jgi:lambda repressor-like predicted transcriptional regulator
MSPLEIKIALMLAGRSQTSIAREYGLTRQAVNEVVRGAASSRRIERRISEVTGIPLSRLWPHRYGRRVA